MPQASNSSNIRVAFLVANEGIEQIELTTPWEFLKSEGALVELVAPNGGTARAMNHLSLADEFPVDRTTSQLNVDDFDAVVLPGGVANPDRLRLDSNAVNFLKKMTAASKPIAAICHGPWTLVEGDLVRGRTLTSWPSLRTDIINAGGNWVDEEVKICTSGSNILVTSRNPHDLPAFCDAILGVFTKGISHSA